MQVAMFKKSVAGAVACCLLWTFAANAQTLSPTVAPSANNNAKQIAPVGAAKTLPNSNASQQKTNNNSVETSTESQKKNAENTSFTKSVKNIDNYDTSYDAKKYDNTYGRVFTFRLKDGHIEFDNNKKRKILVWYDNFHVIKGMDGMTRCSIRVFVLNDLTTRINNLGFKIIWPDIRTSVNMTKVNPGVNTYIDTMLIGDGCFTMDKTPVIEVNRCRVKGMSEESCADAVHWYNRH